MKPLFATLLLAIAATACASEPPLGGQAGVLLLRNGSVMEGNIFRAGDRYEVGLKDGDVRVRADDVEFVGESLDACYEHRRAAISFDKVSDHLELSEWCLRHGLHSLAGKELRDAMVCDPTHPKIGVVERRLRLAIEAQPASKPGEPQRLSAPSAEDLDRLVRGMPAGTVEAFTNTIQPMLINQCSTAGCHGPTSSTTLRLMRVAANRTQSRRATQRNLHAVLSCLDTEKPDNSPLLTVPIRPHGTSRAAMFTNQQTQQYRQLVAWVYAVANQKPESSDAQSGEGDWPTVEKRQPKSIQTTAANDAAESPTIAAKYLEAESKKPAALKEKPSATNRLSRRHLPGQSSMRSQPTRGEVSTEGEPADPFDPEEFNRQTATGD
jgi:hypothetical protein